MPFKILPVIDSEIHDPGDPRNIHPQRVAVSKKGAVATAHYLATDAAVKILEKGGNAVDAAVAAAFTLGVVEPAASGIGGQTMMTIYLSDKKRKIALDGSSRAPNRIIPGKMERTDLLKGYIASTVPSTPATLGYALEKFGRLPLDQVLEPAITLAENGFRITPLHHYLTKREIKRLRNYSAATIFLQGGKSPYAIGSHFRQPALSKTLQRMAKNGIEEFYQGKTARLIHEDMVRNHGLIRKDDLAQIPWPVVRKPLSTSYDNLKIFTMGPPGAGRTLVEALNLLEQFPGYQCDPDTPRGALLLAHVIRKANLDRSDRPADPMLFAQELDFSEDITHKEYAIRIAKRIKSRVQTHGDTTHLSVMDRDGNAVGLTQSIERVFGSFCASPALGFIYNNYMSAFEYTDMSHPYFLRPNASPWASVAPTLIFKGQQPWLVIGSPGSERIVSAILNVLLRLRQNMHPYTAVEAPRMHVSLSGKVSLEASRMRDDIPALLKLHGFTIDPRDAYSFYLGSVQLVMRDWNGDFIGVADPRRDGSAGGGR